MELNDLIMEIQKYLARNGFDASDTTVEELLVVMMNEKFNE